MYDTVITLKKQKAKTYDTEGNEIITYQETDVFAQPRGVYQSEFYNAAQAGLHPSVTFRLTYKGDYHGERVVIWEGTEYTVIRADWTAQRDYIDLICEERVRNG